MQEMLNTQRRTFGDFIDGSKRHKLDRPITGIIQDDRIWEQWYDPSIFSQKLPKMSQKDFLFQCIGDDADRVIINNRGLKTFTVRQFREMIFKYEKAFTAMRLTKGDIICTIGLTTPEMYAIKYSATSLGLILCNLNVFDVDVIDDGKNRLYRQLENVSPKMIFTLDILEDKIYQVINDSKFQSAVKVSMPLEYSTPKWNPEWLAIGLKVGAAKLSGKKIANSISLKQFLKLGDKIADRDVVERYEEGMPCNISFTSGTTGINKPVLLSHDANNALAFQQMLGDFGWKKGTMHLALVSPFLAFWDADIVHAVLCQGGVNIIELALDYKTIPGYFKKYKPNMGVWSQYLWSSVLTLPDNELKKVCQNLRHVIIGGERCEINAAETFYNKTGIVQMTGFGASEVNTTFSITHPNCNKVGSAGIPLPFNNVKIVDEDFRDLTYNVPGRLFITGPCLMNGYYNRDDLTQKAIYVDDKGVSWYNTGDYAVIDEDGCLTVLDRYVPPIILENGEKVNTLDMVETIKKNRNVKNCKITYHTGVFVLHLSIDNFSGLCRNDAIESILSTIKLGLPKSQWPDFIFISDELPRTSVGKVDYNKLQSIGNEVCKKNSSTNKLSIIETI